MKKIIVTVIVLAAVLYLGATFASVESAQKGVASAAMEAKTEYVSRAELIEDLASKTTRLSKEVNQLFSSIKDARSRYEAARTDDERAKISSDIESAYVLLATLIDNTSSLLSAKEISALRSDIEATSGEMAATWRNYNAAVRVYNSKAARFPWSLFFSAKAYFQSADSL